MLFVTLQQAKDHLRIDDDDSDTDVTLKITQAEAIVTDYLKVDPSIAGGLASALDINVTSALV